MRPLAIDSPRLCRTSPRPRLSRRLAPTLQLLETRKLLTGLMNIPAAQTQTLTFPNIETNPNLTGQFLKFQPLAGTLTEIDIQYSGSITSDFAAENLSGTPNTITGTINGVVTASGPNGSVTLSMAPFNESFNASAYDGTLDDAGTSGKDFGPVRNDLTPQTVTLTSPSDMAPFLGAGTVPITLASQTAESASGPGGNVAAGFTTRSSGTVSVVYHFIAAPPSSSPAVTTTPADPTPVTATPSVPSTAPAAFVPTTPSAPAATAPYYGTPASTSGQGNQSIAISHFHTTGHRAPAPRVHAHPHPHPAPHRH